MRPQKGQTLVHPVGVLGAAGRQSQFDAGSGLFRIGKPFG